MPAYTVILRVQENRYNVLYKTHLLYFSNLRMKSRGFATSLFRALLAYFAFCGAVAFCAFCAAQTRAAQRAPYATVNKAKERTMIIFRAWRVSQPVIWPSRSGISAKAGAIIRR